MDRYITKDQRSMLYKQIRYELSKPHPRPLELLVMMDKLPNDSKKSKSLREKIMAFVRS